jgi:hypothetical protein
MLRDEPKRLYIYECIKKEKIKRETPDSNSSQRAFSPRYTYIPPYYVGQTFYYEKDNLNKEYYKILGTFREAFVGDMQKEFDEAMGFDIMRRYAESGSYLGYSKFGVPLSYTTIAPIPKKKSNVIKSLWKKVISKFKKPKSKYNSSLERCLFEERDSTIIESDGYLDALARESFLSPEDEKEMLEKRGAFYKKTNK